MDSWYPSTLVLGSACTRSYPHLYYPHLGALYRLANAGLLSRLNKIVGSGIGAYIALFVCIGKDLTELIFLDAGVCIMDMIFARVINRIFKTLSILGIGARSREDELRERLTELVKLQLSIVPTLNNLYIITGVELIINAYDSNARRFIELSRRTHPDMNCIDAVLASTNYPSIADPSEGLMSGEFCKPYPVLDYDDGSNVLGVITVDSDSPHDFEGHQITGLYDMLIAPSIELTRLNMTMTSDRVKHLKIVCPKVPSNLNMDIRVRLIRSGIDTAREFQEENDVLPVCYDNESEEERSPNLKRLNVDGKIYYEDRDAETERLSSEREDICSDEARERSALISEEKEAFSIVLIAVGHRVSREPKPVVSERKVKRIKITKEMNRLLKRMNAPYE